MGTHPDIPKLHLKRFNFVNLNLVPEQQHGVYSFWSPSGICIYVGMAEKMTLRARLKSHWKKSTNPILRRWVVSSYVVFFGWETVFNKDRIAAKEKEWILSLGPFGNIKDLQT